MARVQIINAHRRYRLRKRPLAAYVRRVLRQEGKSRSDVRIVLIDSKSCRALNRQYLAHDYSTDVISFPLERGPRLEGEVYVNLDRAKSQAREYAVAFANEVARLVIHGTLHLVGYDDRRRTDAERMRARENEHVQFWSFREEGT